MKKLHYFVILLFIIPILFVGVISLADNGATVSEAENRVLETKPNLQIENILNSSFMLQFENYYTDTFPFRDFLLLVNRKLNNLYYSSNKSGIVLVENNFSIGIGEDVVNDTPSLIDDINVFNENKSDTPQLEDLFLETEVDKDDVDSGIPPVGVPKPVKPIVNEGVVSNGVIITENSAMESFAFSQELTDYIAQVIDYFNVIMPNVNIHVMIPPNAAEFYSPKDLWKEESSAKAALTYLKSQLKSANYVDAYSELAKHKDDYIFFRTDHHWTARGAYYGYKAFIDSVGLDPVLLSDLESDYIPDFLGSLLKSVAKYGQSDGLRANPDYVEYFVPKVRYKAISYTSPKMTNGKELLLVDKNYKGTDNKYLVFQGMDSPLLKITTDVNNGKKIVIVRDSYGHAFLPFIVHNYEEIYAIEPRYFNSAGMPTLKLHEFVEKIGADEILFMNYSMFISGGYWFKWVDVIEALQ